MPHGAAEGQTMSHTTIAAADVHQDALRRLRAADAAADACEKFAGCADDLAQIRTPAARVDAFIAAAIKSISAAAAETADSAEWCARNMLDTEENARYIYHQAMRERTAAPFPQCDENEAEAREHFHEVERMREDAQACALTARECAEKIRGLCDAES